MKCGRVKADRDVDNMALSPARTTARTGADIQLS